MHRGASHAALGAVLAAALLLPASQGPVSVPLSRPFDGTAAVGALFTVSAGGRPGQHFCSASVVHSRNGDPVMTAAHGLAGRAIGGARGIMFVPGYHRAVLAARGGPRARAGSAGRGPREQAVNPEN